MSTTSIQYTDDPTASKECQSDGRSGSGAQLLEPAALWFSLPRGGRRRVWNTGYGRPWAAETGTIPVRWVWLSGWLRGGSVPGHFFFFLKRALPDSGRRTAQALPKPDDATKHPRARHRPPRDRYFLRHRRKAGRPRSLSNRPNMAPGRRAHV